MQTKLFFAIATVFALVLTTMPINASAENQEEEIISANIFLKAGIFDPLKEQLNLGRFKAKETNFYILQLNSAVKEQWKIQLQNSGVKIFGYIPDFAFIVKMDKNTKERVAKYDFVRWIGFYEPRYKIDNNLLEKQGQLTLIINVFENPKKTAREIEKYGRILEISNNVIKLMTNAKYIKNIAFINDVEWIEEFPILTTYNDVAKDILNVPTTWNTYGLTGTNQIVGICDTGIDTGINDASMHDDIEGRIVAIFDRVGDGAEDRNSGHGTHVAGSVLGNGSRSNGQIKGMAPNAKLVFQAVESDGGNFGAGLPSDLNVLFQEGYNAGARIHTNSWGSWGQAIEGTYTSFSNDVDEFSWNNKNFTILFAAANQGRDRNADGIIDLESIGAPATAKNSISVGASENNRPSITSTYGSWWSANFPTEPIFSDRMANNIEGLAAFSSRGPTNDNRIKPDVIAPGTWVLSTKSSQTAQVMWGSYNAYYCYAGGTSMATPLTAGAVALIRQYYTDLKGITPTSALIKATLINGATDILGQYGNDANSIPNFNEGWGRVNLTNSLFPSGKILDYKDFNSLTTGEEHNYYYSVSSYAQPLKITLVWTDYPATTTSLIALVNNLDLVLISPSGREYKGNVFENSFSVEGGTADNRNNVENVYIAQPEIGIWTVKIKGTNIPQPPQSYAIVSTGVFSPELKIEDITFSSALPLKGDNIYINATIKNIGSNVPSYFTESFSSINSGSSEQFNDVAFNFVANKEKHPQQLTSYGLIVGNNGKIMKYFANNNTFINLSSPTSNDLNAVEFSKDNSHALIVGNNSTVLRYDGNNFFFESGYSGNLRDVKFYNNFSIIVGDNKVYKRTISYSTIYFDDFEGIELFTHGKDGYSYSSTNYNWIEISAIGTLAHGQNIDDANAPWISLPFKFNYYGYSYNKIRISSNGFVSFTTSSGNTAASNTNLPSSTFLVDAIMPHWDNLHTRTNGRIYYYSTANYFVVQWNNVSAYTDTGDYLTFQVILYKNGTIKFQYKDVTAQNSNGISATVGVQKDYLSAVVYSYNTASLSNNSAIEFKYSPILGDEWQLGNSTSPSPYSGSKMWGTDLNGNYNDYADYILISPTINLSNSVYNNLEFYQWRQFEDTWDTGFVEISKDNKTWERLENKNYIFGSIYTGVNFFPGYFSNTSWQKEVYDISSYKENNINIRFHFRSDSATNYNGWFIDDFKITRGIAIAQEITSINSSVNLNSVAIINSSYSLIVGDNGVVWKFNGSSLSELRNGSEVFNSISPIKLSDTNSDKIADKFKVLIVGNNGVAITYDGTSFSSLTTSTTENLNSISLVEFSSALIVGNNGTILKYCFANETIYYLQSLTENLFSIFTSTFKDSRTIKYDISYIVGKNGKFAKSSSSISYTPIRVGFYLNNLNNLLGNSYINNGISQNSQKIASFYWQNIPYGSYTIYVFVDNNDNIAELNETNNILSKPIRIYDIIIDQEFSAVSSAKSNIFIDSTIENRLVAQSFVPSYENLTRISLYLSSVYINPKNLIIEIRTNAKYGLKDIPSNTILSTKTISFSQIPNQKTWINININKTLTINQKYWIVIKDDSSSRNDYVIWYEKDIFRGESYKKGEMSYSRNGVIWYTYNTNDRFFKSYVLI